MRSIELPWEFIKVGTDPRTEKESENLRTEGRIKRKQTTQELCYMPKSMKNIDDLFKIEGRDRNVSTT